MILTAAFWNCHVHFIEPKWNRADTIATERFNQQMADMLTSHGFAHVFDLAELDIQQTLRIRNRIKKGDVSGPVIYTAGVPLVPLDGSPFYIEPLKLPEATDPQQAALHVRQQIDSGADGIKLWTGSPTTTWYRLYAGSDRHGHHAGSSSPGQAGLCASHRQSGSGNRGGRRRRYSCAYDPRWRQDLESGYPSVDARSAHVGYTDPEALERRASEKWNKRSDA